MSNTFGYPSKDPCRVCGGHKNNQSEPRFGYIVCEDHQNVAPVDLPSQYRIISQPGCKYCRMAKELLASRGLTFSEDMLLTPGSKAAFKAQGFTTVPQIWEGDRHIGGYTQLAAELG